MTLAAQKETLHVSNISEYCLSKDDENDGELPLDNSSMWFDCFTNANPASAEVVKGADSCFFGYLDIWID
jgi:hypothetical protein